MLNFSNPDRFFENCLSECGLEPLSLAALQANPAARAALISSLRDLQSGAEAVLARGKPAEETLDLSLEEWERRWVAWAASRKAAFYSRAAMLMLGETEFKAYFINVLRTSHNLVFLSNASDALQHASGRYLTGPEEDMPNLVLAAWWENH